MSEKSEDGGFLNPPMLAGPMRLEYSVAWTSKNQ
jgi:hypothetical protein